MKLSFALTFNHQLDLRGLYIGAVEALFLVLKAAELVVAVNAVIRIG